MTHYIAGLYNIVATQGSAFERIILWKDPANKPIKLGGYRARLQIRPSVASETVVAEFTTENGHIELGATDGSITLTATSQQTAAIPADKYVYDLELISSSDYVYRLVQGNFAVKAQVTR